MNWQTSVKLQDTALPFLSTWGRRITSFPPWNKTRDGSCLDSGDVDTLYLKNNKLNSSKKTNTFSKIKAFIVWTTPLRQFEKNKRTKLNDLTSWRPPRNVQHPLYQILNQHSYTWNPGREMSEVTLVNVAKCTAYSDWETYLRDRSA